MQQEAHELRSLRLRALKHIAYTLSLKFKAKFFSRIVQLRNTKLYAQFILDREMLGVDPTRHTTYGVPTRDLSREEEDGMFSTMKSSSLFPFEEFLSRQTPGKEV